MQLKPGLLFFGSQITVGGAQRVLLDQAAWFYNRGYRVLVLFYYDKDGKLAEWQKKYPFQIETLSSYRRDAGILRNGLGYLPGLRKLDKFIREFKPAAIECFTHDANITGLPIAWLCKVPVRIATHHGQFADLSNIRKKLHTKIVNSSMTTTLVCVSSRAKNQALQEGIRKDKIQIIYNGIIPVETNSSIREKTRSALGLSDDVKMILNIGRLVPEKAQNLLVDAAMKIKENSSNVHFYIAGEGKQRNELMRQINLNGLEASFDLLGNREDTHALLNAADLFVLYSETEGMPISLMEAMSAGVPIIASDLEGIAELVNSPASGSLIPFGDSNLLADTIIDNLKNKKKREEHGKNGRLRINQNFTLEKSCGLYEKLFFKDKTEEPN